MFVIETKQSQIYNKEAILTEGCFAAFKSIYRPTAPRKKRSDKIDEW